VGLLTTSLAVALPAAAGAAAPAPSGEAAFSAVSPQPSAAGSVNVVVTATPGAAAAAKRAVAALGGRVKRDLPIINGFAAVLPESALRQLAVSPGVRSVSPDRPMKPMSLVPSLGYDPMTDMGSLSAITRMVGAQQAWARGYTGQGVDVAVIDTGVARVPGLDATGKVVDGPDLSFDSPATATQGVDAFGHGTHMASIIAGRDAGVTSSASGCSTCLNSSGYSNTTKFVGVAPNARIVNVKVGAADGATDVSQVIAAIDWVTQHAKDPGFNIRVLNLSFGTESQQPYTVDPLAQAAEQAWKRGIVVVAAAGNDGRSTQSLASPAYDPYLLAVGAVDPKGTLSATDDVVASFAQHGTSNRPVDVVAPGVSVLGLRVPGSFVDTLSGNVGKVGTRFQRGSGTSEATAVVSGLAAVLVQKFPTATPDAIKALIKATATPLTQGQATSTNPGTSLYSGNGIPNADKALNVTGISASP
jgi:serine protease AprX